MRVRIYKIDNIRFILICLTVFGHILSAVVIPDYNFVYRIVYSFHMPAFIFLSGYCCKPSLKRLIKHILLPYIVFQVLYLAADYYAAGASGNLVIQFTGPYRLMWYLLSLGVYYLFAGMLEKESNRIISLVLVIALVCAILIGYESTVDYYFSLSRTIVFLPFFISGFLLKRLDVTGVKSYLERNRSILIFICFVLIIMCEYTFYHYKVPIAAFYASQPYSVANSGPVMRAVLGLNACAWIILLFLVVPNIRIPFISSIGQSTMGIYLLHGFIFIWIDKSTHFKNDGIPGIMFSLILSIFIVGILGSKPVQCLFQKSLHVND